MDIGASIYNSTIYITKAYVFIYILRIVSTVLSNYMIAKSSTSFSLYRTKGED